MFGKIKIEGIIELKSGMHIGGSSAFAAIGAVDSPVVRDVIDGRPIIPGSSLKGKIRTLLARHYSDKYALPTSHKDDDVRVRRIFGETADKRPHAARFIVGDSFVVNYEDFKNKELDLTEVKFENTIDRKTAIANPRQIERATRGLKFGLNIIYNIETDNIEEIKEDFETLAIGFKLLGFDYLGGHGSRGYGQVAIRDIKLRSAVEDVKIKDLKQFEEIFYKGENNES